MGNRSRRTGNREERNLAAQLPGARKISRSGYPGPDIEWRGRHIEVKYRTDEFITLYRWLQDVQILAIRRPRQPWLMVLPIAVPGEVYVGGGRRADGTAPSSEGPDA